MVVPTTNFILQTKVASDSAMSQVLLSNTKSLQTQESAHLNRQQRARHRNNFCNADHFVHLVFIVEDHHLFGIVAIKEILGPKDPAIFREWENHLS